MKKVSFSFQLIPAEVVKTVIAAVAIATAAVAIVLVPVQQSPSP